MRKNRCEPEQVGDEAQLRPDLVAVAGTVMQHGRVLSHAAAAARVEVPTAARHAERQRCRDFAPCRVWPRRVNLRADRKRAGVALAASLNGEPVDLNKLHSALSRAVEAEDYSLAASIRDSINKAMKAQGIEDGPSDWKSIGILPWLADRCGAAQAQGKDGEIGAAVQAT